MAAVTTTSALSIFPLDPTVHRDPLWCSDCAGVQTFVFLFATDTGRVGFCFGCGAEKFVPFTRTMFASPAK